MVNLEKPSKATLAWQEANAERERPARWILAPQEGASAAGGVLAGEGGVLGGYNAGESAIPAFLEDYPFYVWGRIELNQATRKKEFLLDALRLSREMLRLFGAPGGGLYDVGSDAEQLPVRMRNATDGVIPSGTSVAALNLLRLGRIASDQELNRAGEALLRSHMGSVARQPAKYPFLLNPFDFPLGPQAHLPIFRRGSGGRGPGGPRGVFRRRAGGRRGPRVRGPGTRGPPGSGTAASGSSISTPITGCSPASSAAFANRTAPYRPW